MSCVWSEDFDYEAPLSSSKLWKLWVVILPEKTKNMIHQPLFATLQNIRCGVHLLLNIAERRFVPWKNPQEINTRTLDATANC